MHHRTSTSCPLCHNHQTLPHILNFCPVSLNQGRFTWRHNSVLHHLCLTLRTAYATVSHPPNIFADLPGCLSPSGTTIPPNILYTSQRPDLVLIFSYHKIVLLELTVPFEPNISSARCCKSDKYAPLISDLKSAGYFPKLLLLEVGSRGSRHARLCFWPSSVCYCGQI